MNVVLIYLTKFNVQIRRVSGFGLPVSVWHAHADHAGAERSTAKQLACVELIEDV